MRSRTSRGEIAHTAVFNFFMAILATVVLAALLFNYVPAFAKYLYENIFGRAIPVPGSEDLTSAIKCAYYRCTDGCGTPPTQNLAFGGKNCDSDFCKAEWTDTGTINGVICDDLAKIHPVIVSVSGAATISKSDLSFADCLMSEVNYASASESDRTLVKVDNNDVTQKSDMTNCRGQQLIGSSYGELTVKSANYYIWSWKPTALLDRGKKDTSVTTKAPWIKINPDTTVKIDISLTNGVSEIYKIVVESGDSIIDEAFLKVVSLASTQDRECDPDVRTHPHIKFICEENQYSNKPLCIGKPLFCGKFLLTSKEMSGSSPAKFEIKYFSTAPSCESLTASGKSICESYSCKWCPKCNQDTGENQANTWCEIDPATGQTKAGCGDKCVGAGTGCGYTSCNKAACGGCEPATASTDCSSNQACENCKCVSKYCCSYLSNWYCVTDAACTRMGGDNYWNPCSYNSDCD